MRKNLPIVPLVLSLILGVVAFKMTSGYLNKLRAAGQKMAAAQNNNKTGLQQQGFVVAKQDIKKYEAFSEDNLEIIEIQAELMPKGVFGTIQELNAKFAKTDIKKGDLLHSVVVADTEKAETIQDLIPEGLRAFSVTVSDSIVTFINPGDRIDLLAEFSYPNGSRYSKVVLQNILVLARGEQMNTEDASQANSNNKIALSKMISRNGHLITLALTVKEIEALAALGNEHKLRLVFRSVDDQSITATNGTESAYLARGIEKQTSTRQRKIFLY